MKDDVKEHFSWEDDSEENKGVDKGVEKWPKDGEKKEVNEKRKIKKKIRRKKKSNIRKYMWAAALLIIAVSLLAVYKDKIFPEENANAAAIVNGQAITYEQLDSYYRLFVPEQMKLIMTKDIFLENSLISEELLMQEAEKEGISADDREVEFYINNLIASIGITENEFILDLESQGLSLEDIKEAYMRKITIAKLLEDKISSNIIITDKEIREYYENNKEYYSAKQGQIRVSHILVKTEDEAKAALKKINEGTSFGEIAKEMSICPSSEKEGDLGFFGKGAMVPEFEEAAFAMNAGEISDIVKTQFGYHIIKRYQDVLSFEEAKESINSSLFAAKQQSVVETYIAQLKSKAEIALYPEESTLGAVVEEKEMTFKMNDDEICRENEKPVIRMFSAEIDSHSKWINEAFDSVVKEYEGRIIAHNWQIDTGDDLLTIDIEKNIPKEEIDVYKKYNKEGSDPTFVFGCRYARIGNGYEEEDNLFKEEAEFRDVIDKLV